MIISLFTPFHRSEIKFLVEAYDSLKEQTFQDWEWIILKNGKGKKADLSFLKDDPRVKIYDTDVTKCIGALKKMACSHCAGDVLCEFDFDDLLLPDCLMELNETFKDESIHMAYSNFCEFRDETWEPHVYGENFGWRSRPFKYKDKDLVEMIAFPPSPHMMRRVEWAPNHVRAFRRTSYNEIGQHNYTIMTGDDHDLCCRFYVNYGAAGIKHIDKCLYLYRLHGKNSCVVDNNEVQIQVDKNYTKYSRQLAIRWAQDNKLRMLDLGGRFGAWPDFETVDLLDADIITNLNERWPFEDSSVGVIRASHIFEHLKDSIHTFNEAFRVLAPGGWLLVEVPSTDGRGAWQDPTHISNFNANSFWYYTRNSHARYIQPQFKGRFQLGRAVRDITWADGVKVVEADLICVKPPYSDRPAGEVLM